MCKLIKNENPESKITKLVYGRENFNFLRKHNESLYEEIICIEDLIDDLYNNKKNFSQEEIDLIESKIDHSLTHIAYCERTLVQHTSNLAYSRRFSQSEIINQICGIVKFVESYVINNDIIYAYTCASPVSEALYYFSKRYKKRFITPFETRLDYRWSLIDNNRDFHPQILDFYKKGIITKEGKEIINSFTAKLNNNIKNEIESNFQKAIIADKQLNLKNITRFLFNLLKSNKSQSFIHPNKFQIILKNIKIIFTTKMEHFYLKNELPKEKYIYLPLSLIPEASLLIRGLKYYDTLSFIKSISAEIPFGFKLVVREHPSMAGRNDISFYREVSKIFNVHLISYKVNPHKVLKKSDAIITVTGSTGFEAASIGKKVILFGHPIYSMINTIYKVDDISDLGDVLRRKWTLENVKQQEIEVFKYGSAVISGTSIRDNEKILWTKESRNEDILKIDREIYKEFNRIVKKINK